MIPLNHRGKADRDANCGISKLSFREIDGMEKSRDSQLEACLLKDQTCTKSWEPCMIGIITRTFIINSLADHLCNLYEFYLSKPTNVYK